MLHFDSDARVDRRGTAASTAGRRRRATRAPPDDAAKLQDIQGLPGWARISEQAAPADDPAFFAGAGLALVDQVLAAAPPFTGALRQRLALRAATACARTARRREDERDLRDAEHLAAGADPGPAGRLHRPWRLFALASRSMRLDASTLAMAADLVGPTRRISTPSATSDRTRRIRSWRRQRRALPRSTRSRARRRSTSRLRAVGGGPSAGAEVRLGGAGPASHIPRCAAARAVASAPRQSRLGGGRGLRLCARRARRSCARQRACAPSGKTADRRAEVARQEGSRVVEQLLSDDAVSPARAAKAAGLSDRACRRLFDRLVEFGAARELSGRPSFRLYGL